MHFHILYNDGAFVFCTMCVKCILMFCTMYDSTFSCFAHCDGAFSCFAQCVTVQSCVLYNVLWCILMSGTMCDGAVSCFAQCVTVQSSVLYNV